MNDILFGVAGGFLYQINADHSTVNLGGQISDTAGPISMDDNGTELVIVNGVNGYIWSAAAGFRLISDPDFHPAETVSFMDGFFLYDWKGTGKFFRSDLLDGTSYDGTAFTTAESKSDNLLAVRNQTQILYALGTSSIELYNNTGAANFPFQRIPGATISRGIASPHVIADEDESLFILGEDRIAYRLSGRSLQRISTHAIENEWQNYAKVSDAFALSYGWNGHKFVCFTFPSIAASWEYDIATSLWHERESRDRLGIPLGRWRANCSASAYGRVYIGDVFSGKLGYLSNTTYTEFGDGTVAEAISPPLHGSGKRVFMPWFELDIETGVGLSGASGDDAHATVLLHLDLSTGFSDSGRAPSRIWTAAGDAQISAATSKFGGASLLLDGTGDYLSTPDSADITLGSGDFTIDGWFNCTGVTGVDASIAGQVDAAFTAAGSSWDLRRRNSNLIRFEWMSGASFLSITGTTQFTNLINPGWHHFAAVRSGNSFMLFIDGQMEASTVSAVTINDSAAALELGRTGASSSFWFGSIDEFRLSVGFARWTANFTPPTAASSGPPIAPQGDNPMVMLSISDNGGWSFDPPELWASMGRRGETDGTAYQLRWDRLGNFFERCVKVSVSDPVRRTIYAARGPEMSVGT